MAQRVSIVYLCFTMTFFIIGLHVTRSLSPIQVRSHIVYRYFIFIVYLYHSLSVPHPVNTERVNPYLNSYESRSPLYSRSFTVRTSGTDHTQSTAQGLSVYNYECVTSSISVGESVDFIINIHVMRRKFKSFGRILWLLHQTPKQ